MVGAQSASGAVNFGTAILAPVIRENFDISLAMTGVVLAAVSAGITVGLVPWGLLADHVGERVTLMVGLIAASCVLGFVGNVASFPLFLVLLFAAGLCLGCVIPSSGRAIMHWFGAERRGLAAGLRQIGAPLGALAAGLFLPQAVAAWGLDVAFLGLSGFCLIWVAVIVRYMIAPQKRPPVKRPPEEPKPSADPRVWRTAVSGSLLFASQVATVTFVVIFLNEERGLSLSLSAAVFVAIQIGGSVLRILLGWRSDTKGSRLGPVRRVLLVSNTLLLLLALASHAQIVITVLLFVVVGSLSMSTGGLLLLAAAEFGGAARSGIAVGIQQASLGISATLAPIGYGIIVEWSSWTLAFVIAAAVGFLAYPILGGSLQAPDERGNGQPQPVA